MINNYFLNSLVTVVSFAGIFSLIGYRLSDSVVDLSLLTPDKEKHIGDFDENFHLTNLSEKNVEAREYLLNNVFSFLWKNKNNNNYEELLTSNGFLLNFWIDDGDDVPDWSNKLTKFNFLFGTSLTFATKLFDEVDDFSNDVNNAKKAPKISEKSSKKNENVFLISNFKTEKNQKHEPVLNPVHLITNSINEYEVNENKYHMILNSNVELVYAAADFSINEKLFDLNTNSLFKNDFLKKINEINSQKKEKIVWKKGDSKGSFSVDFAAIKIQMTLDELNEHFINHLKSLYNDDTSLYSFTSNNYSVENKKTKEFVFGGWKKLSKKRSNYLISKNLVFDIFAKDSNKLLTINPSTINEKNFSEYFDLKIFPNSRRSNDSNLASEYEYKNLIFQPNDEKGFLTFEYQLFNKVENLLFPKKYKKLFTSFKKEDENKNQSLHVLDVSNDKNERYKYQFFSQKPLPVVEWGEFFQKEANYSLEKLNNHYFSLINEEKKEINLSNKLTKWEFKNKSYVNIGHNILLLGMPLNEFKGTPAIAIQWNKEKKNQILGIYGGNFKKANMLKESSEFGEFVLLNSPTRYNLISKSNNYTKPSLMDSLIKKEYSENLFDNSVFK